jgi:hypothetical protein
MSNLLTEVSPVNTRRALFTQRTNGAGRRRTKKDFQVIRLPLHHLYSKASAKAREFEKWRGQNEGDNSAPRMLKNGQQSCPSKQRCDTSG